MPDLLLVEDDRDVREAIAELLEQEGYAVVQARSGLEAIQRLNDAATPPAAILLDLMMPIMDGWEFLARRQNNQDWSAIPIVVISADAAGRDRVEGLDSVFSYLRKPIDIDRLLSVLAQLSGGARTTATEGGGGRGDA